MTNEERAELLGEVWRFPCEFNKRTRLLGFIVESNGDGVHDKKVMIRLTICGLWLGGQLSRGVGLAMRLGSAGF